MYCDLWPYVLWPLDFKIQKRIVSAETIRGNTVHMYISIHFLAASRLCKYIFFKKSELWTIKLYFICKVLCIFKVMLRSIELFFTISCEDEFWFNTWKDVCIMVELYILWLCLNDTSSWLGNSMILSGHFLATCNKIFNKTEVLPSPCARSC